MVVQERLERLLIASFKYMGVAELKQVCALCRVVHVHGVGSCM